MFGPYSIQFAASVAVVLPLIFIPLIAQSYRANPATIGILVATYQGMIFLSSMVFGRLADLKDRKIFVLLGLLFAGLVFFSHRFINNLSSLFLIRILAGLAMGTFPAALIAYVYEKNNNLGKFTALGSLGWGVGSFLAGIIGNYQRLFLISGLLFSFASLTAWLLLKPEKSVIEQPFINLAILKRNLRVYLAFFLRHSGASGIWAIFPLYLAQLGANKFWIGLIYGLNAFAQFLFMPFLDRVKSRRLVIWGLYLSMLTFIIFGLVKDYRQIVPFQLLLAFSWSCLYLGSLKYLMEHNRERSTVVGVFNSILSLAGIIGPLLGGLVGSLGFPWVMFFAALLSLSGALFFR